MAKKTIDQDLYRKIAINDLILFSVYSVSEKKENCSFERLMEECFGSFPKSFAFPGFSKWPDSRKLDRTLRSLRGKKLIKGSPQTVFSLTKTGKERARITAERFGQRKLKL